MAARARVLYDGTLTDPRLDHPEGLAVARDGGIWCGGEQGQIYRLDPEAGRLEQVASTGGFCLGMAFGTDRQLYVCDLGHQAVLRVDPLSGAIEPFVTGTTERRLKVPNFPAFGPDGRLYVSDSNGMHDPGPGIYRFDPEGHGELWHAGPFDFANGLALAADGRTLYVAETFAQRILRIPIDGHGRPAPAQLLATLPGVLPDGLALATNGTLYVACYEPSQVLAVQPDGAVQVVLADPEAHLLCHPTNIAFRGTSLVAANLGRWHLTVLDVGARGLALPP